MIGRRQHDEIAGCPATPARFDLGTVQPARCLPLSAGDAVEVGDVAASPGKQSETPMPATRRPLLDINGVAEYLGVTVRHIRRLVAERRIPYIKWGSQLHFDPDEIDAWVERHRRPERGVS